MKLRSSTSLGIDISDSGIQMALVRNGTAGIELVRCASAPLPPGAVKDGNVENAALLTRALLDLRRRKRMRASRAAVSLFAKPAIMQIIDMPGQMPTNVRQFVQNEVRQYVAAPAKEVVLDFCDVTGLRRSGDKRVLAVASDNRKVSTLAGLCGHAGLNVEVVEPPLLSYARALHKTKVAAKVGCNVLIAMFREPTLTLCVFKNQQVDFVRTKDIGKELGKAGKTVPWLIEELAQVVQFYEVEVLGSPGKWEITLLVDSHDSVQDAGEGLKARLPDAKLSIFNADAAYHDISVKQSQGAADTPSPVAVGLAMRLAVKETAVPQVNLMPSNIVKLRTIRRDALVAANAVAATLLMAILAVDVPALKTERVWRNVAEHRASISALNLSELREQQRVLDRQLKLQTDTISRITAIPRVQRDIDWADMLKEIKKAVPRTVCITNIESKDNTRMSVEGLALNNDAVRALVIALKRSKHVSSAALLESEKADLETGIVRYQVNCSLIDTKGESADAE